MNSAVLANPFSQYRLCIRYLWKGKDISEKRRVKNGESNKVRRRKGKSGVKFHTKACRFFVQAFVRSLPSFTRRKERNR